MAGKPTKLKLTKELIKQVKEYADVKYQEFDHLLPSIAGLSEYVNIPRETLLKWKFEKDTSLQIEFANTLEAMLAKPERLLLDAGLTGKWKANVVKIMLEYSHGYSGEAEAKVKPDPLAWTFQ